MNMYSAHPLHPQKMRPCINLDWESLNTKYWPQQIKEENEIIYQVVSLICSQQQLLRHDALSSMVEPNQVYKQNNINFKGFNTEINKYLGSIIQIDFVQQPQTFSVIVLIFSPSPLLCTWIMWMPAHYDMYSNQSTILCTWIMWMPAHYDMYSNQSTIL